MANQEFIFSVNTLAGCKFTVLRELLSKFEVEEKYLQKLRSSTSLSILTTFLSYFDELRYRFLARKLTINKDPIYILGHWRSGTTLLHNLLCCHENVAYPTTYQTVFPNNLFFMKGLMKAIMQHYLPRERLVDRVEMHVDNPQEEGFALGNEAGFSFYYWYYFPSDHRQITQEYLNLSAADPKKIQRFKTGYERFIKRCILNIGGEQYIAKNPPNMARIPFLLDLFPQSRFIYIERNPYEVLMSTFRFHKGFLRTLQLQDIDDASLWEFICSTYDLLYRKYQDSRHLIQAANLVEISYEQLVADPASMYEYLHKGIIPDLKTDPGKLGSLLQSSKEHSANTYDFSREYLDRVNERLGPVIREQGYELL